MHTLFDGFDVRDHLLPAPVSPFCVVRQNPLALKRLLSRLLIQTPARPLAGRLSASTTVTQTGIALPRYPVLKGNLGRYSSTSVAHAGRLCLNTQATTRTTRWSSVMSLGNIGRGQSRDKVVDNRDKVVDIVVNRPPPVDKWNKPIIIKRVS